MKYTFGAYVRAARLGYHPVGGIGFVRILEGGPPHEVNLAPFDHVPTEKNSRDRRKHVVWWEGEHHAIIKAIQEAVGVLVLKPTTIYLDDDGKITTAEPPASSA